MRLITAWLLGFLGVLTVTSTSSNAAILRQSFALTVTRVTPPSVESPDPALNNLPLPGIGTQGRGSFTYDESQLNYMNQPVSYPVGYYLGRPGNIAFLDFSLDFFGRTYTEWTSGQGRIGQFLLFDRTESGQYIPQALFVDAIEGGTTVRILDQFLTYYPASPFLYSPSVIGSASGTFRYTDLEVVPEPPTAAIASFLALGMGWLYDRKRRARRNR